MKTHKTTTVRNAAAARTTATSAPLFEALESRQLQSASVPTVAGYLPDYSATPATIAKLDYSTLNTINYFSVNPDSNGYIPGTNGEASATSVGGQPLSLLQNAVATAHGHGVKINIVVGGAGQNLAFENFMGDATKRTTFANSVKDFCARFGLDGVDLDYETPGDRGISTQQIADYSKLIAAVDAAAPALHLSAAVAPDKVALATPILNPNTGKQAVDAHGALQWSTDWGTRNWVLDQAAIPHLDEIGVMAYDYSPGAGNADQTKALASMNAWADRAVSSGGSRQQVLLGLPFYGRSGPSDWGLAGDTGGATYNDILRGHAGGLPDVSATSTVSTVADTGWPHTLDNKAVTWFYDNPATIQAKTTAAVNAHVGGVMIWDVTQDYFNNAGGYDQSRSLLPAVKRGLAAGTATNPTPTTPTAPPAPVDSRTARIMGRVFFDGDQNGQFDGYNAGNANQTVFLDTNNNGQIDAGEKTAETDADGNYTFELLPAGTYNVRLEAKSYYFSTTPIGKQVTLAVDEDVFNVDFGEWVTYRSGR